MSDYFDEHGNLVWESDEFDDRVHRSLIELGLIIPCTAEEVQWAEEALRGQPVPELPESLRDPAKLLDRLTAEPKYQKSSKCTN